MTMKAADRARYMIEEPFYPWPTEAKAYSYWVAIRCKNYRVLRALTACLHVASLFLAPKTAHGTTPFIPAEAWTGFGKALIEETPIVSEIEVVEVCRKEHLNPIFLSRFGRPGHSKQHAWYQANMATRSGTPHNAYSSVFLIRSIVEEEIQRAHEDFMRTQARMKKSRGTEGDKGMRETT